ncbi:unnamed protein product [Meloidogyne enterolobii]|uniref:Uncharacterized protein n=1 Tax=Meloidogyne enterolobii TaxID=390850 RepID=A0ACB0YAC8_MELEN
MPQGANIRQLSYSKEVEASAAKWAEKCTISHSHGNYGENLFMSSNPKTKTADALTYACNAWWAEVKNIGIQGNLIMDKSLPGNGHATQMAWATTTQIGCALARCPGSYTTHLIGQLIQSFGTRLLSTGRLSPWPVANGHGLNWSWTQLVMDSTGHGLNWSWTQLVMDSTGHGLNWPWTQTAGDSDGQRLKRPLLNSLVSKDWMS